MMVEREGSKAGIYVARTGTAGREEGIPASLNGRFLSGGAFGTGQLKLPSDILCAKMDRNFTADANRPKMKENHISGFFAQLF